MSFGKIFALLLSIALSLGLIYFVAYSPKQAPSETKNILEMDASPADSSAEWLPVQVFLELHHRHQATADRSLDLIDHYWRDSYIIVLTESLRMSKNDDRKSDILALLEKKTKQKLGGNFQLWNELAWADKSEPYPEYSEFKSQVHTAIDKHFAEYFNKETTPLISLEEIVWGGVRQDGIPPLRKPKMVSAEEATYLEDSNVVFGVYINGDARCYPKRILAHHEMFTDTIGGESVNGVYCTLCGSLIVYNTLIDGKHYELGTSGFLYRSNKLMYDQETQSLWSTLEGKPVVGALAGSDLHLSTLQCVTTTWGQWRRQHPNTTALSLETGHSRDYDEGAAYSSYFATDEIMFKVPNMDTRLKNKAEILALRFGNVSEEQMVLSADFLAATPIYHNQYSGTPFVVLTDDKGANRVYESGEQKFESFGEQNDSKFKSVVDANGDSWNVTEDSLTHSNGTVLKRLPAHRAFWFGWFAQFPNTKLIK